MRCFLPYPVYSQAQGVVKDLEPELLQHLAQGTASLLITTKGSPQGELRGQVGRQRDPVGMGWHCVHLRWSFALSKPLGW